MVVVWYVALQQAKRLLALSPLQPIKKGCGIKETVPPTEETVRSSGSLAVDEELDRVCCHIHSLLLFIRPSFVVVYR